MIRRHYIDNQDGGQIHIAEAGQGDAVLLIHQTPRSHDEFREVMDYLSPDFHLIAIDLPGMGASTLPGQNASIELYARAAAQTIEHYGNLPLAVCGHHTGGVVAIELAASRPELVSSLILSSTPWVDAQAREQRARKTPIDMAAPSRDGHHLADLWRQRSAYYPDKTEYMNRFMADALKCSDPAQGHLAVGRYHMERAAPLIKCPVLIIDHMKDPFGVKYSPALQAAFPHATTVQIPDGVVALEVTARHFSENLGAWLHLGGKLTQNQKLGAL